MKILIPIDGSIPSLEAVRYALRLQREGLKASFILATVQEPTFLFEMMLAPNSDVLERVTGAVGARSLQDAEGLFNVAGVLFKREIGSGNVPETLLEIAQSHSCDAIIMGARGWGVLRSALLGSVSHAVLQEATVPITLVKHVASV
jgi:nucleotide-binding universal stress UspA family protein